jgi:hypothetical protein
MTTTVVNIYELENRHPNWYNDSQYVYIGRPGFGRAGEWGNPFPLKDEKDRGACLKKYINWLFRIWTLELGLKIKMLKGKTLVCFCSPKLCHGDILALLADIL